LSMRIISATSCTTARRTPPETGSTSLPNRRCLSSLTARCTLRPPANWRSTDCCRSRRHSWRLDEAYGEPKLLIGVVRAPPSHKIVHQATGVFGGLVDFGVKSKPVPRGETVARDV